jgi:hypothetical protein
LALKEGDGAVQALDRGAEVGVLSFGQAALQSDFAQQLQRVADVLDRPLAVALARVPAAAIQRAAPLGAAPSIDDGAALVAGAERRDDLPPRLAAAVGSGPPVGEKTAEVQLPCPPVGRRGAGRGFQNAGSVARVAAET